MLRALAAWLETIAGIQVIGRVISGSEDVAQVRTMKPDVIMMDILITGVPIERSLATIREMKDLCPEARIIVMSHLGLDHTWLAGAAGIDLWLAKDQVVVELVPALAALFPWWLADSS